MFHNAMDLLCSEPSPSSPSEKFFDSSELSATGSSTSEHNIHLHRQLMSSTEVVGHGDHHHHHHQKNLDLMSSPLSSLSDASSGYDSVTTTLSSVSSIDQEFGSRPCHDQLVAPFDDSESIVMTRGHIDQHMLDDIRIPRQMLAIEDRYVPWNVDELVYGSSRHETDENARRILTEWMVEVCEELKCEEVVFPLAVNYLDRFLLATPNVQKSQLQLVAVVCLLIASKLRQCASLDPNDLSYMTDYSVTVKEILTWEALILKRLNWDVSSVVATDYLDHILVILPELFRQQSGDIRKCSSQQTPSSTSKQTQQKSYPSSLSVPSATQSTAIVDSFCSITGSMGSCSLSQCNSTAASPLSNNTNTCWSSSTTHQRKRPFDDFLTDPVSPMSVSCSSSPKRIKECETRLEDSNCGEVVATIWNQQPTTTNAGDDHQSLEQTIRRHANTFISLCSTELQFICVKPSVIATACVATAIRGIFSQRQYRNKLLPSSLSSSMLQHHLHHHHYHHNRRSHALSQHCCCRNGTSTVSDDQLFAVDVVDDHQSVVLSVETPNHWQTMPSSNNNVQNNQEQHFRSMEHNLYERFLCLIEKQIGIDSTYIEHYVNRIEALFSQRSSKLADTTTGQSSSTVSDSSRGSSSPSTDCSASMSTGVTNHCKAVTASHKSSHHSHPHHANHRQLSSSLHSNYTDSASNVVNGQSMSAHNTAASYHYTHTTYAQVASAKQLLLAGPTNVSQSSAVLARSSHQNHQYNRYHAHSHRASVNGHYIPPMSASQCRASLHDTTNGSTGSILYPLLNSASPVTTANHHHRHSDSDHNDGKQSKANQEQQQQCHANHSTTSTTTATTGVLSLPELLSTFTYHLDEDRENIPVIILENGNATATGNSSNTNINSNNRLHFLLADNENLSDFEDDNEVDNSDHNDDDDDDEGLQEDLYF